MERIPHRMSGNDFEQFLLFERIFVLSLRCFFLSVDFAIGKTIFHTLCATRIIKNKRLNLHAHANFSSIARFRIYLFVYLPAVLSRSFYHFCTPLRLQHRMSLIHLPALCDRQFNREKNSHTEHLASLFRNFVSTSCMLKTTQIMQ